MLSIVRETGVCSLCGADGPCVKSASGVLICTRCLTEAKQMVQEEPELLEGVVLCPNCNGKVFAVTELVIYDQDKHGNFTAFDVVIDEDPQVRCLRCGLLMTDSAYHTILNRTAESADEVQGQSA
ncbi:hypothetical protein MUP59_11635 [Candidatus Bathyarchaeota archaeon]|nr:hypothetical protein [Candidatus Bathyarchaeota archaeon]